MKVTQEKLPASQIGLEIEIPAETSQSIYEKVVQNLARSTNIPGFRKGKVPRQVLLQRLGTTAVKAAVLEELIQKGLESALKQESIDSLGNPKLLSSFDDLIQVYEPGKTLTFSASVEVPPSLSLGDYQNLTISAEETLYDPQAVENWLSERQQQQAALIPIEDRGAEMGDVAIVDYQGKSAETGEDLADVQGEDLQVDLQDGRFITGMVEGIVGMKPEEVKELTLTFPDDYPQEELAGQLVIFTITLKELKAKELPELDDDFAQEVSEYETIAELQEVLEKRFREQAEKETKDSIQEALIAELVRDVQLDLPATLIEQEVGQILTQTFMQMQQMRIDVKHLFTPENVPRMRENARPDAIENLTRTLTLREVAKVEGIEADQAAVKEKMAQVLAQISDPNIDRDRLRALITEEVLAEKTLDWLKEKANLTLVPKGSLAVEVEEATEDTSEAVAVEVEEATEDTSEAVAVEASIEEE
jgi:trigger factor